MNLIGKMQNVGFQTINMVAALYWDWKHMKGPYTERISDWNEEKHYTRMSLLYTDWTTYLFSDFFLNEGSIDYVT